MESSPFVRLRKALGLSQVEMARAFGVTGSRLSQIERGGGRLSDERMVRLVEAYRDELDRLGLSLEDFMRADATRGPATPTSEAGGA